MGVEPLHREYDLDIQLDPYNNSVWKSPDARDFFRNSLERAAMDKSMAEWRSVSDGRTDRRAAIVHVNNSNRDEWIQRVGEHGLHYRPIRYTSPYGGFAHSFSPTDESDPERITYGVVAENSDIADKMEEAELEMSGREKHNTVGELLGFPECCRDFFYKWFIDNEIKDPIYECACNSDSAVAVNGDRETIRVEDPNDGINPLFRYFGYAFITHIPCSMDCDGSVDIARSRYRLMAEYGDEEAADKLAKWLSFPATQTVWKGAMEVRNRHFAGSQKGSAYASRKKIIYKEPHESQGQKPGVDGASMAGDGV